MDVLRDPLHSPPLAADTISSGHILVTDCRPDATAAFGGSLLLTLLQVRGITGLVTAAGLRDVEAIADLSLPCFAAGASAPTNLAHRHGVDIDLPIGGGGALVCPGDTVVGDGVIAVAAHLAEGFATEVGPVEHFEDFALVETLSAPPLSALMQPMIRHSSARGLSGLGGCQPDGPRGHSRPCCNADL